MMAGADGVRTGVQTRLCRSCLHEMDNLRREDAPSTKNNSNFNILITWPEGLKLQVQSVRPPQLQVVETYHAVHYIVADAGLEMAPTLQGADRILSRPPPS